MEYQSETLNITSVGAEEETSVNVSELVIKLRILLNEKYKDLRLPPDGDNVLERCLYHRKFNMNQAADQVHCFFKFFHDMNRMKNENLFIPSALRSYFLDSFSIGVLKQRDPTGTFVVFGNFGYNNTMVADTFCAVKTVAVAIMMLNELTRTLVDKRNMQVVGLLNLKGFQFGHVKQFSFSRLRAVAKLMQGSLPVSFKAFHAINAPAIFYYTFAIIKPLLRQKIRKRIHLHGSDRTEYYKVVDKSLLPIALDGDLPNEQAVDTDFTQELCEKDEYYREFLRYGYPTQLKNNNS